MEYGVMEQYWIWLSSVDGIGPRRFYQLLSLFGDARDVWENMGDSRMRFLPQNVQAALRAARSEKYFFELFAKLESKGIRARTRLSDDYPNRLLETVDPPPTLYVRGDADLSAERMFAVVGSRRCSRDGARAAREFSEKLAREGVTVVSGLAFGIDAAAHEGAVRADGVTIAVLGSGADVIYPMENERLAGEILEKGGAIVSEYPPGMPPLATNFPARNRIISGMSAGVLLVEGAKKSGAMITVDFALEQGRDVFAVPGSIYSPLCGAEPDHRRGRAGRRVALGHPLLLPVGGTARTGGGETRPGARRGRENRLRAPRARKNDAHGAFRNHRFYFCKITFTLDNFGASRNNK